MLICWTTEDGEEHEEEWSTVEAFRSWAVSEGLGCRFSAYESDDEDDRVLVARGRVRD
ncbi:MAG: hypothetical protein ACOCYN_01665 [Planctomycetota bacterium]